MDKFVAACERAYSQPTVQAQIEKIGVFPEFLGPKEFANLVNEEYDLYMELAKRRGQTK